jgi:PAS domain S-box-containing protein
MEAIKRVQEQDFAVILLDVQMPIMDGLDTAEEIRKLQGSNLTPIIFVTAGELTEDIVHRAYAEGAVDFLFKPYAPQIVRSKVQVFVDLFKNSQRLKHNVKELARAEEEVRQLNQALEKRVEDRTRALAEALTDAEASEQKYRQLAESLPQIVWMSEADGTVNYCNSRFYEYTGLADSDNPNDKWEKLTHQDDLPMVRAKWAAAQQSGEPLEVEFRLLRGCDQAWRYHMARAEALRMADGTVEKWLGIATDIEDKMQAEATLKAANQVLAEARDRAVEASHAKSLFLANMSHELRTPLNAILGYAEMLEEELSPSNSDLKEDADRIITAGRHLLSLIDDVLDMAKIEAGKMKLSLDSVNVGSLVEDVATAIRGLAKQRNNSLHINVDNDLGTAWVDPVKLRQILINLLSNACKFTENGSIEVECRKQNHHGREWFAIAIKDTGIGIPEEELEHLFKEFSQADPSPSRNYGGTGLGLALSQRFANMMGGMITLTSEKGVGSTFTVSLPMDLS